MNESAGDNLAHNVQITRRVHLAGVYNLSVTYVLDGPWPMAWAMAWFREMLSMKYPPSAGST